MILNTLLRVPPSAGPFTLELKLGPLLSFISEQEDSGPNQLSSRGFPFGQERQKKLSLLRTQCDPKHSLQWQTIDGQAGS